ncbi:hypothetical protein [Mesorhizobium sp. WSM2239]|uniref:Uncharacterized protein n=2 Tax=unclassified Mesorhizobium TaxID=325217 RepID=A0AAU8DIQ5_9HYPH
MAHFRLANPLSVALLVLLAPIGGLWAQTVPSEEHITFSSLSLTDEQFLKGNLANAKFVTLGAKLQLPSTSPTAFPP